MILFRAVSLSLVLLGVLAPAAFAAEKKGQPQMPAPIQNLANEGAQVRYLGNEGGLDGWLTLKSGQPQYFYVTPDRQSIVMGVLFNNKGDVITLKQLEAMRGKDAPGLDMLAGFQLGGPDAAKAEASAVSAPDFDNPNALAKAAANSKSERLYAEVQAANWIAVGQEEAPAIYSFIDPECPHCHDLIDDVRKSGLMEKGQVQLRLIPVGLISEDSLKEAALLLAAPNAQELLFRHLDGDKAALKAPADINTQGVQRNMSLMQEWKFDVTPFSIYKDATGAVKILRGRPENLKKLVESLR